MAPCKFYFRTLFIFVSFTLWLAIRGTPESQNVAEDVDDDDSSGDHQISTKSIEEFSTEEVTSRFVRTRNGDQISGNAVEELESEGTTPTFFSDHGGDENSKKAIEEFGSEEITPTFIMTDEVNVTILTLAEATTLILEEFVSLTTSKPPSPIDDDGGYLGLVLRFEIFTKAAGLNFILPPSKNEKLEAHLRSVTRALVHVWLKLEHSETANLILNRLVYNIVFERISSVVPVTEDGLQSIFRTLLERMNPAVLESDPQLARVYAESLTGGSTLLTNATAFFPFEVLKQGLIDTEKVHEWLTNENTARCLIHLQVLNTMKRENGTKNAALLRLVFDLAKKFDNCQNIYTKALTRMAVSFKPEKFPYGTMRLFVDELDSSMEADPSVEETWTLLKRERLARLRQAAQNHRIQSLHSFP